MRTMVRKKLNNNGIGDQLSPHRAKRAGFAHSNVLLIAVFAAGVLCVYVLGLREPPQTVSGEQHPRQAPVETQPKDLGKSDSTAGPKPGKGMGIVDTFYYQAKQRQIPVEALASNPFVSRSSRLVAPKPKMPAKDVEDQDDSVTEAIKRVKELKLQSVMVGSGQAAAMISGELLTKGQKIRGWTVVQIESRRVVLSWRDQKFVLEMSQ